MVTGKLQKVLKMIVLPVMIFSIMFTLAAPLAYANQGDDQQASPAEEPQVEETVTAFGEQWTQDEYILAQIIFREAGNQDCIGQLGVAQVVINRMNSGEYLDAIDEVILQRHQFTPTDHKRWFLRTKPTLKELTHARASLNDYYREKSGLPRIMPTVVPETVMYFNGKGGRNHFYYFQGRRRVYVHPEAEGKVCDYCKAIEAVNTLNLVGPTPATTETPR